MLSILICLLNVSTFVFIVCHYGDKFIICKFMSLREHYLNVSDINNNSLIHETNIILIFLLYLFILSISFLIASIKYTKNSFYLTHKYWIDVLYRLWCLLLWIFMCASKGLLYLVIKMYLYGTESIKLVKNYYIHRVYKMEEKIELVEFYSSTFKYTLKNNLLHQKECTFSKELLLQINTFIDTLHINIDSNKLQQLYTKEEIRSVVETCMKARLDAFILESTTKSNSIFTTSTWIPEYVNWVYNNFSYYLLPICLCSFSILLLFVFFLDTKSSKKIFESIVLLQDKKLQALKETAYTMDSNFMKIAQKLWILRNHYEHCELQHNIKQLEELEEQLIQFNSSQPIVNTQDNGPLNIKPINVKK